MGRCGFRGFVGGVGYTAVTYPIYHPSQPEFFAQEDEGFLDLPGVGLRQLDRFDRLRELFDDFGRFCGCPLFAEWSA